MDTPMHAAAVPDADIPSLKLPRLRHGKLADRIAAAFPPLVPLEKLEEPLI